MSAPDRRAPSFASRPRDRDAWVATPEPSSGERGKADVFTARLTVDVTPTLRGRIKVAAFMRGITVADMPRAMLERAFPSDGGDAS